ncbi:MAG: hypothetical protein ACKPCL_12860 [Dolichospermum sp.]
MSLGQGNREQGTGNREQGTGNRFWATLLFVTYVGFFPFSSCIPTIDVDIYLVHDFL